MRVMAPESTVNAWKDSSPAKRHSLLEFLPGNLVVKAIEKARPLLRVHDVPHLRLAGLTLDPLGICVVGVHLHGEVVLRIDDFLSNTSILL